MNPRNMSPDAIRAVGDQLADYAARCNSWAEALDKVGVGTIGVKSYSAWPRAITELTRFFASLESAVLSELERRGAYHAEGPDQETQKPPEGGG